MKKTGVRLVAILIVVIMVLGLFSGALAMFAGAAEATPLRPRPTIVSGSIKLENASSMVVGKANSRAFSVKFRFRLSGATLKKVDGSYGKTGNIDFIIPADSSFLFTNDSKFKVESVSGTGIPANSYDVTFNDISYNGGSDTTLSVEVTANEGTEENPDEYTMYFDVPIGSKYIRGSSSSSSEDDDEETPPESDIVVESVTVKDGSGKVLTEVDKDTPPFTVEIVYSDLGLSDVGRFRFDNARMEAFITSASGFKTPGGTRGEVALISYATRYPRFRATFKNIQCDETSDSLSFRIQYDIDLYESSISGPGTAILYQVSTSEEDKDKALLKPNLIIEQYSYGTEPIVAGSEFDLAMTVTNTSRETGVENVVMTIEPANGFNIMTGVNSVVFQNIPAGSSVPYSVVLRTMPAVDATTTTSGTDYSVTVKFTYAYPISDKEYADGDASVKIAIPVSQLDRFEVDTITEYSQYLSVGEEGYVTIPITNKGKSPTYNISGVIKSDFGEIIAPSTYYGNLEAGKSDTIDLAFTVNTPGEFNGEAVITYEDENMKQKQLVMPFVTMVQERMENPGIMPPDMFPEPPSAQGPNLYSVLLCVAGGLLMAVPIALYTIKRTKAKGDEDLDEDF